MKDQQDNPNSDRWEQYEKECSQNTPRKLDVGSLLNHNAKELDVMMHTTDEWRLEAWVRTAIPLAKELTSILHGLTVSQSLEETDAIVKRLILAHLKVWMNVNSPIYGGRAK